MPFTPYHFGPHALVAFPLRRYIDLPVFVLSNVAVDVEPLLVMLFDLEYPLHGYCHTFMFGAIVGFVWAMIAWPLRGLFSKIMTFFRLCYRPTLCKMVISGVLGVWLHVLFDASPYSDIRPFYPLDANPLHGLISIQAIYTICLIAFGAALLLYCVSIVARMRKA